MDHLAKTTKEPSLIDNIPDYNFEKAIKGRDLKTDDELIDEEIAMMK